MLGLFFCFICYMHMIYFVNVFTLGCLIYELMILESPFSTSRDCFSLSKNIVEENYKKLSQRNFKNNINFDYSLFQLVNSMMRKVMNYILFCFLDIFYEFMVC
jgi:serine/threonine protein kinase